MDVVNNEFEVGECKGQKLVDGEQMPLVVRPAEAQKRGVCSLVAALKANKEWFEEKLMQHSAVLLRGFDVRDAEGFNDIVDAFGWDDIRYVGPAPRTHIHKRVWTANEGPLSEFIYYHHEMVLIKEFPTKVILFCQVPPPEGGETPFVPSFRVTERMLEEYPDNVREMEEKGLRYSFTAVSKNDTTSMRGRGWEDAFGTSDPVEAERRASALGMNIEWLPNGGVKTILGPRPLTRVFPGRKARRMWFNTVVGMHGKETSSATMADGSEIPEHVVKRCGEIIEEESVQFKWEEGDVLFLDNLALLHGRRPSLPPRRVLVATCK
ncbi:Taurine catabolism dioxygenase TauD, TfdA family [Musa troglodytarum]|uniref:Taurine catabolism dioxygenase TauD, TfdA family n=1 Tax=Musa troglodytarum TaxID=320322 RepID=A0A9E7H238_9LILI|nr:Taurine catabolism dioxygenase TauD, TfdA family [Musa troglodytarum]